MHRICDRGFFDFHLLFCFILLPRASVLEECEIVVNSCVYPAANHFALVSVFSVSKFKTCLRCLRVGGGGVMETPKPALRNCENPTQTSQSRDSAKFRLFSTSAFHCSVVQLPLLSSRFWAFGAWISIPFITTFSEHKQRWDADIESNSLVECSKTLKYSLNISMGSCLGQIPWPPRSTALFYECSLSVQRLKKWYHHIYLMGAWAVFQSCVLHGRILNTLWQMMTHFGHHSQEIWTWNSNYCTVVLIIVVFLQFTSSSFLNDVVWLCLSIFYLKLE